MNYTELHKLADAQTLVARNAGLYVSEDGEELRVAADNHSAVWRPDGLVELDTSLVATTDSNWQPRCWPRGIRWHATTSPRKEYIEVTGYDKNIRYYLMPPYKGYGTANRTYLTIQPHPVLNYTPVYPITDYRITVSRKKKNAAMKVWQPVFDYMHTIWDLLPIDQPVLPPATIDLEDKEPWYRLCQHYKRSTIGKEGVKYFIEKIVMATDLPYNVELVPNTHMSHTDHWSWNLIDKLHAKGELKDLPVWEPK